MRLTTTGAVDRSFVGSGEVIVGLASGYLFSLYVVLAASGMPTTVVHRSVNVDASDPDRGRAASRSQLIAPTLAVSMSTCNVNLLERSINANQLCCTPYVRWVHGVGVHTTSGVHRTRYR